MVPPEASAGVAPMASPVLCMSGGAGNDTSTSPEASSAAANAGMSSTATGPWPASGGTVTSRSASTGPTLTTTPLGMPVVPPV
jgi:hypothetical protein